MSEQTSTSAPVELADASAAEAAVEAVTRTAERLISAAPASLRRLRLESGAARVEMEWSDPAVLVDAQRYAQEPAITAAAVTGAVAAGGIAAAQAADAVGKTPLHYVCAPMVGTFYRAPEPGAEPFVREGDAVVAGQQIAILEAMKMMLPVEADIDGEVMRVIAGDSTGVEYGEQLMAIAPRATAATRGDRS
ncbi:acetyl-CoA carboxylase biotin carboxyl carrier protein [Micromonospora sp. NPDC048830]|uniref:acetyl-CoA carboxylase biotin carboxyl carrier protein n=1 Tax=Micromonospora sp. NPDC048830 TaxID=3364257 RepID=UPI003713271D